MVVVHSGGGGGVVVTVFVLVIFVDVDDDVVVKHGDFMETEGRVIFLLQSYQVGFGYSALLSGLPFIFDTLLETLSNLPS